VTNEKRNPPKTEKCPTCGGEAKLDERRYTEQDEVAYSCRNGLSHYFFDTDPRLEVHRLRSELDRARKALTDIVTPVPGEKIEGYALRVNLTAHKALAAFNAPTENKNG
jgi:hypothetical protein